MKILHIDNHRILIDSVKKTLESSYTVDHACTGYQGIEDAFSIRYSLILLDLGLPDMDGYEVCRTLRKAGITTPIIILTVRKDPETLVKLLNCGADDYITKPFNSEALKARVAAALRRGQEMSEEKIISIND